MNRRRWCAFYRSGPESGGRAEEGTGTLRRRSVCLPRPRSRKKLFARDPTLVRRTRRASRWKFSAQNWETDRFSRVLEGCRAMRAARRSSRTDQTAEYRTVTELGSLRMVPDLPTASEQRRRRAFSKIARPAVDFAKFLRKPPSAVSRKRVRRAPSSMSISVHRILYRKVHLYT